MSDASLTDEVLIRGLDDWVMLVEVAGLARDRSHGPSDEAVVERTCDAIADLLENELVEVGDVTEAAAGFQPWSTERPAAVVARIRTEWLALGRGPNMGDVCWISNTPAGDERARSILAARETRASGN